MQFFDPHFHIWDIQSGLHSASLLGPEAVASYPSYYPAQYEADIAAVTVDGQSLSLRGGVFVEAMAPDVMQEALWAASQLKEVKGKNYRLVVGIDFLQPIADLRAYLANLQERVGPEMIVGCRQILNYMPSWPLVKFDFLQDEGWIQTFLTLVAKERLIPSFDIQCNPHQLHTAVNRVFVNVPHDIPLILNHLGTFQEGQDEAQYKEAISAFAKLPNAYVKISMCWYRKDTAKAVAAVEWIVSLFGADRCMVASNAPVDAMFSIPSGGEPKGPFQVIHEVISKFSPETQRKLMFETAEKVYRAVRSAN